MEVVNLPEGAKVQSLGYNSLDRTLVVLYVGVPQGFVYHDVNAAVGLSASQTDDPSAHVAQHVHGKHFATNFAGSHMDQPPAQESQEIKPGDVGDARSVLGS